MVIQNLRTYCYESNSSLINTSISSNILTINSISDQYGSAELTIIANDGALDSEPLTFSLDVDNINDAPSLSDISDQLVDEDSSNISISIIPLDVDLEDSLFVSVSSSNIDLIESDNISLIFSSATTGNERVITLNPKDNAFGTSNITVTITDGLESI